MGVYNRIGTVGQQSQNLPEPVQSQDLSTVIISSFQTVIEAMGGDVPAETGPRGLSETGKNDETSLLTKAERKDLTTKLLQNNDKNEKDVGKEKKKSIKEQQKKQEKEWSQAVLKEMQAFSKATENPLKGFAELGDKITAGLIGKGMGLVSKILPFGKKENAGKSEVAELGPKSIAAGGKESSTGTLANIDKNITDLTTHFIGGEDDKLKKQQSKKIEDEKKEAATAKIEKKKDKEVAEAALKSSQATSVATMAIGQTVGKIALVAVAIIGFIALFPVLVHLITDFYLDFASTKGDFMVKLKNGADTVVHNIKAALMTAFQTVLKALKSTWLFKDVNIGEFGLSKGEGATEEEKKEFEKIDYQLKALNDRKEFLASEEGKELYKGKPAEYMEAVKDLEKAYAQKEKEGISLSRWNELNAKIHDTNNEQGQYDELLARANAKENLSEEEWERLNELAHKSLDPLPNVLNDHKLAVAQQSNILKELESGNMTEDQLQRAFEKSTKNSSEFEKAQLKADIEKIKNTDGFKFKDSTFAERLNRSSGEYMDAVGKFGEAVNHFINGTGKVSNTNVVTTVVNAPANTTSAVSNK